MSYVVTWLPDAEQELARIWLAAADRAEVTYVADWIEQRLKSDPEDAGESRSDGRRILLSAPLGIIFRVLAPDRRVVISHVWWLGSPA